MKIKMLLALGVFCALTLPAIAQQKDNPEVYRDTIIIAPNENCKVLFIGDDIENMVKFTRLDTLITMLIADIETAKNKSAIPEESKTVHYFISATGRRRLKAEGEDYLEPEIDVEKEQQSLDLDLPPYLYIIHDLRTGVECYIYLKDPNDLNKLNEVNFSDALTFAGKKSRFTSYYRIDINKQSGLWSYTNSVLGHSRRMVEYNFFMPAGVSIFGSQLSPKFALLYQLVFKNKYGVGEAKGEFEISGYTFTQVNNFELSNVYPVTSFAPKVLVNLTQDNERFSKPPFLGIEFGWFTTFKSSQPGWLNGAHKFGLVTEDARMNLSLDVIWDKKKNVYYGLDFTFNLMSLNYSNH